MLQHHHGVYGTVVSGKSLSLIDWKSDAGSPQRQLCFLLVYWFGKLFQFWCLTAASFSVQIIHHSSCTLIERNIIFCSFHAAAVSN